MPFSDDRRLRVNFISSPGRGYFWMTSSLLLFVPFWCIFINQHISGKRSKELYSSKSTFTTNWIKRKQNDTLETQYKYPEKSVRKLKAKPIPNYTSLCKSLKFLKKKNHFCLTCLFDAYYINVSRKRYGFYCVSIKKHPNVIIYVISSVLQRSFFV